MQREIMNDEIVSELAAGLQDIFGDKLCCI